MPPAPIVADPSPESRAILESDLEHDLELRQLCARRGSFGFECGSCKRRLRAVGGVGVEVVCPCGLSIRVEWKWNGETR